MWTEQFNHHRASQGHRSSFSSSSSTRLSMCFQGLWLRLEDAEVFFYATSRISPDQRFQIEERSRLQIVNSSSSSELLIYSLIIDDVRSTDQGTYSCQADNRIIKLFLLNLVGEWCSFPLLRAIELVVCLRRTSFFRHGWIHHSLSNEGRKEPFHRLWISRPTESIDSLDEEDRR